MNKEEIADYIEERMKDVEDKLLEQFAWIIRDGIEGEAGRVYLATTNHMNPPLVIFYPDAMEQHHQTKEQIDQVIRHEIVHACFRGDEHQAYGLSELNVWKALHSPGAHVDIVDREVLQG